MAAWRKATAVELATQGRTYEQIAAEVGYANRGTAYRVVQQALGSRTVEAVENHREAETARLDALQHALWGAALAGDIPAVRAVVRIIETRSRLLGLYGDVRPADQPPRSVVLTPPELNPEH